MKKIVFGNTSWSVLELLICFLGILSSVLLHDFFKQVLGFYNVTYLVTVLIFWIPIFLFYFIKLRREIFKQLDLYAFVKYLGLSLSIALLTSNLTVNFVKVYRLKAKAEQIKAKDYLLQLSIKVPQRTGYECATFYFRKLKSVIPISGKFYSDFVARGGSRYIKVSVKVLNDEYAILQDYVLIDQ